MAHSSVIRKFVLPVLLAADLGACGTALVLDAEVHGSSPEVSVLALKDLGSFGNAQLMQAKVLVKNDTGTNLTNITFRVKDSTGDLKVLAQTSSALSKKQAESVKVLYSVPDGQVKSTGTIQVQGTRGDNGYTPWSSTFVGSASGLQ